MKSIQRFKSVFLLLAIIIVGYTPLNAQNQYWHTPLEGGFVLNKDASGNIIITDQQVEVLDGNSVKRFTPFGRTLESRYIPPAGGLSHLFFVDEERDDIIVNATRHAVLNRLSLNVVDKLNPIFPNEVELSAEYDSQSPAHFKPVCLKVDANDYFLVDDKMVFHIKIIDLENHQINYSLTHDANRITAGIVKNGIIYLTDVNGDVLRYDNQGFVDKFSFPSLSPLAIISVDGGFVLTGEEGDQTFVAKISDDGTPEWKNYYNQLRGIAILQTAENDFVVTGSTYSEGGFVLRTDEDGNEKWLIDDLPVPGIVINENQYGAFYVLSRDLGTSMESYLNKIGPDGETGPLVQNTGSFPLQANNINANVSSTGQLFFDGNDGQYFFPNGSNTATFFNAALWMGGFDDAGNIHMAVGQYLTTEGYQMGPFGGDPSFFERIWSVSTAEIQMVQNDLLDGAQNVDWPLDISQWPAKGNTLVNDDNETYVIEEDLAPFVDGNNDGIYNVSDGDYPLIKGEQMLWWIFSDNAQNPFANVGIEVKASFHATGCSPNHIANNTTYLDYEITNKSTFSYPDFSLGFWSDPDLGCYTDDFIGSLPDYNAAYVYNEDALDGEINTSCPGGVNTYGAEVPVQSIVFLNQPLTSFSYFMNPSVGNPFPGTFDPVDEMTYYNYMIGLWRDGTPMTNGGNGYNPLSTDVVTHAFPGEPSNPDEWSLCSIDAETADRRTVMGTKYADFNPGDVIELNMAFITSEGVALPCPDIDIITADITTIQGVFDNGGSAYHLDLYEGLEIDYDANTAIIDAGAGAASYEWSTGSMEQSIEVTVAQDYSVTVVDFNGCEHVATIAIDFVNSIGEIANSSDQFTLYPNPTRDQLTIGSKDGSTVESLGIYSLSGKLVKQVNAIGNDNQISVGDLPSGMYLVNIKSGNRSYIKKFVLTN